MQVSQSSSSSSSSSSASLLRSLWQSLFYYDVCVGQVTVKNATTIHPCTIHPRRHRNYFQQFKIMISPQP